jgi:hypothetical protein
MLPDSLAQVLETFLADARSAFVLEHGEELFDLSSARYSITADRSKCLLHLWSSERNTVRRVVAAEVKKDALILSVQRFGQSKPSPLEIVRDRDRRTSSAKRAERAAYTRQLERVLKTNFPEWSASKLTNSVDLERSFGPIYTRGLLQRGRSAFAVLGVNAEETHAAIDAALTFGILWLDLCRHSDTRVVVEGLKLVLPAGQSDVVRARMAHLDHRVAKFQLYELQDGELIEVDCRDRGNIATRLTPCIDQVANRGRFHQDIQAVFELLDKERTGATELKLASATELSFRLYGLEFARARITASEDFERKHEIIFGTGANETVLNDATAELFRQLTARLFESRSPGNRNRSDALWRMQPERWLESLVVRDVSMIIELKAEEDIHLPLQGLDYWARVQWHHSRSEFHRFGYFAGRELSAEPPLLLLVTPALHVHPATDTLLRYISPEIDCTLLGIHENWREEQRVVFRKKREQLLLRRKPGHPPGAWYDSASNSPAKEAVR